MKELLLLLSFLILSIHHVNSQVEKGYKMSVFITGGGQNIQIVGDESSVFVDSLFAHYPKTNKNGYVWKFKKVSVPGVEEPLIFQVHQGIYGLTGQKSCGTDSTCVGSYFHTFSNKKNKASLLANKRSTEQNAITVHLKRGRNYGVTSEEVELIKAYLLSLYGV